MAINTDVEEATIVHISVKKVGTDYKLAIYPPRLGDTVAFHTDPAKPRSPERPREVVWVAHGIPKDMSIKLEAKNPIAVPGQRLFPENDYVIPWDAPQVHSGGSQRAKQGGDLWSYSVTLLDQAGKRLAWIDPDVIVQPDP